MTEEKPTTATTTRAKKPAAVEANAAKPTIFELINTISHEAGALAPEAKGGGR